MIQFNFNLFLTENILSVKEIRDKTKIDLQILYFSKRNGRIKPENLKKIIRFFPEANNYITKRDM